MHVVMMPLSSLRPAPYNPRMELEPRDPRYRKLRRSLLRFGLVEPLVWNRRTGHVVGGHQRLKILRELGWKQVPVSVVDLPPEQERALNIVLNNREAQSDWDTARLRDLLEELDAHPDAPLADTGFDSAHLDLLRSRLEPAPAVEGEAPGFQGVELILCLSKAQYEQLRSELDALISKHDLEVHVRLP